MRQIFLLVAVSALCAVSAHAQDAVKADPKHYKVEVDNDQVRVLRVQYGPGEKSVMHQHPATVAVFLTDAHAKFTQTDGKTKEGSPKAGDVIYSPADTHLPENIGDKPFGLILVELKGKPAPGR